MLTYEKFAYIIRFDCVSQDICEKRFNTLILPPGLLAHQKQKVSEMVRHSYQQNFPWNKVYTSAPCWRCFFLLSVAHSPMGRIKTFKKRSYTVLLTMLAKCSKLHLTQMFFFTSRFTYCHLSGISPQFPHFSFKLRRNYGEGKKSIACVNETEGERGCNAS